MNWPREIPIDRKTKPHNANESEETRSHATKPTTTNEKEETEHRPERATNTPTNGIQRRRTRRTNMGTRGHWLPTAATDIRPITGCDSLTILIPTEDPSKQQQIGQAHATNWEPLLH
jgi:hypothetical protein